MTIKKKEMNLLIDRRSNPPRKDKRNEIFGTGNFDWQKEDAKKEDAKQESLQESFFEIQNKNRNVSRKVSNILSKLY